MNIRQRFWCAVWAVVGTSIAAPAQTGTWLADLTDSGDGDGLIELGESAILSFSLDLIPDVGTEIQPGFRVNNVQVVRPQFSGISNLETGVSTLFSINPYFIPNYEVIVRPDGSVGFDGALSNQFQIPDTRDPFPVFSVWWTPADYTFREVRYVLEAIEHENVVADGTMRVAYNLWPDIILADWPVPDAEFAFLVIPTPSGAATLAFFGAWAARRRRRA